MGSFYGSGLSYCKTIISNFEQIKKLSADAVDNRFQLFCKKNGFTRTEK
jgi:hypothetical protein